MLFKLPLVLEPQPEGGFAVTSPLLPELVTLEALGCQELPRRGGGSYRNGLNPQTRRITTLPDHGSCDLKMGTLRAAGKRTRDRRE